MTWWKNWSARYKKPSNESRGDRNNKVSLLNYANTVKVRARDKRGWLLPKHGESKTLMWRAWYAMIGRCENPHHKYYSYYGGRGITVSLEWHDFAIFKHDMGNRPDGATVERRDNNLGYFKDNCFWATRAQQMRNTRRNKYYEKDGVRLCLADWEKRLCLPKGTISKRIYSGWTLDEAVMPLVIVTRNPITGKFQT